MNNRPDYLVSALRYHREGAAPLYALGFSAFDPAQHGLHFTPPAQWCLIIAGPFQVAAEVTPEVRAGAAALVSALGRDGQLQTKSGAHLFLGARREAVDRFLCQWEGRVFHPASHLIRLAEGLEVAEQQTARARQWSRAWKAAATQQRQRLRFTADNARRWRRKWAQRGLILICARTLLETPAGADHAAALDSLRRAVRDYDQRESAPAPTRRFLTN